MGGWLPLRPSRRLDRDCIREEHWRTCPLRPIIHLPPILLVFPIRADARLSPALLLGAMRILLVLDLCVDAGRMVEVAVVVPPPIKVLLCPMAIAGDSLDVCATAIPSGFPSAEEAFLPDGAAIGSLHSLPAPAGRFLDAGAAYVGGIYVL